MFDKAFVKGALGALITVLVIGCGYWSYQRYQEFAFMRSVIYQIVENSKQQNAQQQQAKPPAPSESPTK